VLIAERSKFPSNFGTARGVAFQEGTLLWQLALSEKSYKSRALELIWYDIFVNTAIGLTPGGSSTVHMYTQTIHRTIQRKQNVQNIHNNKNI